MVQRWWHWGKDSGQSWRLRCSSAVTRMDRIRDEDTIRGTEHVGCFEDKTREGRMRWFGTRWSGTVKYIRRRMLKLEPAGQDRGKPKRKFVKFVGVTEDAGNGFRYSLNLPNSKSVFKATWHLEWLTSQNSIYFQLKLRKKSKKWREKKLSHVGSDFCSRAGRTLWNLR